MSVLLKIDNKYMNFTIVIAQTLGIVLTIISLSVLINRKSVSIAIEEIIKNQGFLWLWGFIILSMGAVMIALNNTWNSNLQSLVTVLGWLTLIKGAFILVLPNSAVSFYRKCNKNSIITTGAIVALVVGLALLYKGFM